jgi:hypothetical protein
MIFQTRSKQKDTEAIILSSDTAASDDVSKKDTTLITDASFEFPDPKAPLDSDTIIESMIARGQEQYSQLSPLSVRMIFFTYSQLQM